MPMKSFLITTIILIILITSVFTVTLPKTQATELNLTQKGEIFLGNVLNLDLTKYYIETKTYPLDSSSLYLGIVPQDSIGYKLTSEHNKIELVCTFIDGNLHMLFVTNNEGTAQLLETDNNSPIEVARSFLASYQNFADNALFGGLVSTLEKAQQGENFTTTLGNIALEATYAADSATFRWHYAANGAEASYSKFISLVVKNGLVTGFIDNWQLYTVGNNAVNLTEKEASEIALQATKAHVAGFEKYGLNQNNINGSNVRWARLIFDNSLNVSVPRSKDLLELFPVWRVGIALDKWYGSMYGVEVDIWADTKEIRSIEEAWGDLPLSDQQEIVNTTSIQQNIANPIATQQVGASIPTKESELNIQPILIVTGGFLFGTGLTITYLSCKRGKLPKYLLRSKPMALVTLSLIVLLLVPIGLVSANTKTAVVWGAESTGATGYQGPDGPSWRKQACEVTQQQSTAITIRNYFANYGGYTAYNHQGTVGPSTHLAILSDINSYNSVNSRAVYIDFDHGNWYDKSLTDRNHFIFEDQVGTLIGTFDDYLNHRVVSNPTGLVYDDEINARTNSSTTLFVLINACNSGALFNLLDGTRWQGTSNKIGLPYGFTHRTVENKEDPIPGISFDIKSHMSDDAYFYPDDGCQVFMGFVGGSISLSQKMPYPDGTNYYSTFIERFFYDALYYDDTSVNCALDMSSFETLGGRYYSDTLCPLRSFTAYWWMPPETHLNPLGPGHLVVYGNGRIQLKSFSDDFNDGNYNGWTVIPPGSWTVTGGKLKAQQGNSLIRTNEQFSNDRFLRAKVQTLTTGTNSWDVAWVMAKYVDNNNKVYGLIHKDGKVELSLFRNGQQYPWQSAANSTLHPTDWHTIEVNIVGNKGWVFVDGVFKISGTSDYFDDFSGYAALHTHTSATAYFDDITVVEQQPWSTYHKLTVNSSTGGTTSIAPGVYNYTAGTPVTVTAYPSTGYHFSHWHDYGVDACTQNPITVTMNAPHKLQPQFTADYYVTFQVASGSGTTDPSVGVHSYNQGQVVPIHAIASPGQVFDHWDSLGLMNIANSHSADTTATIWSNGTIMAYFHQSQCSVTVTSDGHLTTNPSGTSVYTYGAAIPISATNTPGYEFDHWVSPGNTIDNLYSASTTAHLTNDGTITAISHPAGVTSWTVHTCYYVYDGYVGTAQVGEDWQTVDAGWHDFYYPNQWEDPWFPGYMSDFWYAITDDGLQSCNYIPFHVQITRDTTINVYYITNFSGMRDFPPTEETG